MFQSILQKDGVCLVSVFPFPTNRSGPNQHPPKNVSFKLANRVIYGMSKNW